MIWHHDMISGPKTKPGQLEDVWPSHPGATHRSVAGLPGMAPAPATHGHGEKAAGWPRGDLGDAQTAGWPWGMVCHRCHRCTERLQRSQRNCWIFIIFITDEVQEIYSSSCSTLCSSRTFTKKRRRCLCFGTSNSDEVDSMWLPG